MISSYNEERDSWPLEVVTYFVWNCKGEDYTHFRFTDHIIEEGNELFVRIDKLSLEGIVGKRADSLYVGGRTKA